MFIKFVSFNVVLPNTNDMTDLEKSIKIIETAKKNGFAQAFLPEPDYTTIEILRKSYSIYLGWNNKHCTGYVLRGFGYIVNLN